MNTRTKAIPAILAGLLFVLGSFGTGTAQGAKFKGEMGPVVSALGTSKKAAKRAPARILFAYQHNAELQGAVNNASGDYNTITAAATRAQFVQLRRIDCQVGGGKCPFYAGTVDSRIVRSKAYNGKRVLGAYVVDVKDDLGKHSLTFAPNGVLLGGIHKVGKPTRRKYTRGAFTVNGIVSYQTRSCDGLSGGVASKPATGIDTKFVTLSSSGTGHGQFRKAIAERQSANPDQSTPATCGTASPAPQPTEPTCSGQNGVTNTFERIDDQGNQQFTLTANPTFAGQQVAKVEWNFGDGAPLFTTASLSVQHSYPNEDRLNSVIATVTFTSGASVSCMGTVGQKRVP